MQIPLQQSKLSDNLVLNYTARDAFNIQDIQIIAQNGTTFTKHTGWTNLLDTASSVACWFSTKDCYNNNYTSLVFCAIAPINKKPGDLLYQIGNPCSQNSHCTKAGYGKCDAAMGLCYP